MAAAYLGSTSAALAVTAPEAMVSVYGFPGSGALFRITSLSPPVAHVTLGGAPQGVAITPDDSEAWVTDNQSFTVSVVDLASNTVLATVPVGTRPF